MACRRFSLSITAFGLLLILLVLPGLLVLLGSPSADQVGAQELGGKQAYLSGQRPAEASRSSANGAPTNQALKPAGKMGFVPASPTPRDDVPKLPRSVANPVVRRAVPQPPKYAVSAGSAPEAPRAQKSDSRSVASRPVQQPQQRQPSAVAPPKPNTIASEAVVRTSPASGPRQQINLTEPAEESLPSMEPDEAVETTVVEMRPSQFRTLDEPAEEEMPPFEEPADEPAPVQTPKRSVVQNFFENEVADEESDELMVLDDEPLMDAKRDAEIPEEIQPVAPHREVAQEVSPSTHANRPNAREIGRKQLYASGQRSVEASRGSSNHAATNQAAKPSNKLSFIPGSPSTREGIPNDPRSVANPLTRRAVPQPPKFAATAPPVQEAPQTQRPDPRSIVSRPGKPQPNTVASKPAAPQKSERLPLPDEKLEPHPALAKSPSPVRTLEEPPFEEPPFDEPRIEESIAVKPPEKGVVQLFFEDEPADENTDEVMELDRPSTPTKRANDIQPVAAQGDATEPTAQVQTADQDPSLDKIEKERMAKIMADLRPVSEVDVGLAVKLPLAGKNDSDEVREPDDQALAILRHRKPFNIFAVSRGPWQASRDSYPFFHKPLWFEDPNLERCGRGHGLFTTAVSAVHFSANIPILPYRFTAEKPWSCVRTLPDCTVCEKFGCDAYLPPWSLSAAAVQAAATVGIIYIVP